MNHLDDSQLQAILGGLRDFQRRTVDYVFRRMYEDSPPAHRFLVADEVGLGKTLVAKGLIAKAIHRLQDRVRRVDVIYICSNSQIAEQNLSRLNVLGDRKLTLATRLTMLPQVIKEGGIRGNGINFISFTPGTALEHGGRGGTWQERRVLYHLLRHEELDLSDKGLANVLRGSVGVERWNSVLQDERVACDEELGEDFVRAVRKDRKLFTELRELCAEVENRRTVFPPELLKQRLALVGRLRALLARVCVRALEPDLIILDEFQRFRQILTGDDDAALLARELMQYHDRDTGECARTLLLSATPYKLLTLHDEEENHYSDFLETVRFLLGDDAAVAELGTSLQDFRRALMGLRREDMAHAASIRDRVQAQLSQVIARTERVSAGVDREAMLRQKHSAADLVARDLHHARAFDGVARSIDQHDVVEYWKSCAYPLNFMSRERYGLKRRLQELQEKPKPGVTQALRASQPHLLHKGIFRRFQVLDPGNARMRRLVQDMLDGGLWRLLWLPPSLPYYQLEEPWASLATATKALVFSHWNVVPDTIASICSYEAERRMTEGSPAAYNYFDVKSRKPLLKYNKDARGGLAGFGTMLLMYPSPSLASLGDPLRLRTDTAPAQPTLEACRARVAEEIRRRLAACPHWKPEKAGEAVGAGDQLLWYAKAILALDADSYPAIRQWILSQGEDRWVTTRDHAEADDEDHTAGEAERRHREEFARLLAGEFPTGRPPEDLAEVLADLALAGPAVTCLRALNRQRSLPHDHAGLLTAASRAANGLRTLFNQPEVIVFLMSSLEAEGGYWRRALSYCASGNLQAVLDEYSHVLWDQAALAGRPEADALHTASVQMEEAMSLRPSSLSLDTFRVHGNDDGFEIHSIKLRCRFAHRLGGEATGDEGQAVHRADVLRRAFNSPFRPFILATTSIGQEGLDFHPYCHAIYHWNLPSNPVDLEQREGRIHRYKGHAVRKNIAATCASAAMERLASGTSETDPWAILFAEAAASCEGRRSDLVPYWLFPCENGAFIERRVPLHPLSRDAARLQQLRKSLAVYRLAFGQPRQEDLLAFLEDQLALGAHDGLTAEDFDSLKISLEPPGTLGPQASSPGAVNSDPGGNTGRV